MTVFPPHGEPSLRNTLLFAGASLSASGPVLPWWAPDALPWGLAAPRAADENGDEGPDDDEDEDEDDDDDDDLDDDDDDEDDLDDEDDDLDDLDDDEDEDDEDEP